MANLVYISIHALREEGDFLRGQSSCARRNFYPRPPRGGRPWPRSGSRWTSAFLSTPSARRATRSSAVVDGQRAISIHALREEGDGDRRLPDAQGRDFYPRPPRGGRRVAPQRVRWQGQFLSTPSARRATKALFQRWGGVRNFYPRPPRGGRPVAALTVDNARIISIHALREEGDKAADRVCDDRDVFLSTPSARRATRRQSSTLPSRRNFYPRPPRGGRPPGGSRPRAA